MRIIKRHIFVKDIFYFLQSQYCFSGICPVPCAFQQSSNVQVEEVGVKRVLKSSIFVVQKATAPKTGVEFLQGSIGSLAMSYDVWRSRAASPWKLDMERQKKERISTCRSRAYYISAGQKVNGFNNLICLPFPLPCWLSNLFSYSYKFFLPTQLLWGCYCCVCCVLLLSISKYLRLLIFQCFSLFDIAHGWVCLMK